MGKKSEVEEKLRELGFRKSPSVKNGFVKRIGGTRAYLHILQDARVEILNDWAGAEYSRVNRMSDKSRSGLIKKLEAKGIKVVKYSHA